MHRLKQIESAVYPEHMQQIRYCQSLEDLADYCECSQSQVIIRTGEGWYLIVADHGSYIEAVDFAALPEVRVEAIRGLFSCFGIFKEKKVLLDCRSSIYCLVKKIINRLGGTILHEEEWDWEDEEMVEMVIQL